MPLVHHHRRWIGLLLAGALNFAVAASAQETQPPGEVPTLPPVRIEGNQPTPTYFQPEDTGLTGTILDGTIFSNAPAQGYRAPTSVTGTIIAIPDVSNPATVSTITRAMINDQVALRFTDMLRNVGGVGILGDGLFPDRLFIRGLEVGSRNFRKNGFLDPTYVARDPQNIDRIEILKGPASFIYGSGDPAGIVNVVTKTAQVNNPFAVGGFTFGSFQEQRWTVDANSNVTQSGNVIARVNVAQEDRQNFVDFGYLNRTDVTPTLTWLIDDDTTLTWMGEWHKNNTQGFAGTPAVNGNPLALPPNRFIGLPGQDGIRAQEFRQQLLLTHEFNNGWVGTIGGNSLFYQFPGQQTFALSPLGGPFFARGVQQILSENEQSQSMIANLAGEFDTGGLHHTAITGMEYVYFDSNSAYNLNAIATPAPPPFFINPVPFNAVTPNYNSPTPQLPILNSQFPVFRQQRVGGYMQDFIDLTPTFKAVAGMRYDTLTQTFDRTINGVTAPNPTQDFTYFTPRGGLVYLPFADQSMSLYYNYSQSFTPPGGGIYLNPNPLKPILGQGHEIGVKTQLLDNLSLNGALFDISRRNDEFNTGAGILVQVGEVKSRGAELNLVGNITERWSATANYTYTDARLFDSNLGFNGQNARNVPFNTANFWSRYNIIQDDDRIVGAALGLVYAGQRAADLANTLTLPGFDRWDAGLFYTRGRMTATVYLENIFDVQYATSSASSLQIFQGAPFNTRANILYSF
ncbi:MAG TPA: TonB-dependent siderophore receptor [Pirellulaceae bacterium]|jgi:iron complex outermembrane receptor protein